MGWKLVILFLLFAVGYHCVVNNFHSDNDQENDKR